MEKFKAFLKRKDIEISLKRYGIDALGAMAQGLFCSLLIGTIINTIGTQFHIPFLTMAVATVNDTQYTVGSLASAMSGPAMAVAIGYALHCPPLVLFSLITVGFASRIVAGKAAASISVRSTSLFTAFIWDRRVLFLILYASFSFLDLSLICGSLCFLFTEQTAPEFMVVLYHIFS